MFHTNSLESLVLSLSKTDKTQFKHLETLIGFHYPNADYKLPFRKGVFSYEYLDSSEKFNEPSLLNRVAFFSTLRKEMCLMEDFDYAQRVWRAFRCLTLEDYLKLYLASNVCQLADLQKFPQNLLLKL